jgi:hypothetical protein
MKWGLLILLATCSARSTAAQLVNVMPVWNDPAGGRGHNAIAVDVGAPNNSAGGGTAYGARLIAGGRISASLGVARWSPSAIRPGGPLQSQTEHVTAVGLDARLRLLGRDDSPFALGLQAGGTFLNSSVSNTSELTPFGGAGASFRLPVPGLHLEPFLSLTVREHNVHDTDHTEYNLGFTIGATADLSEKLGLHVAYDSEKRTVCSVTSPTCAPTVTAGILGAGVHMMLP